MRGENVCREKDKDGQKREREREGEIEVKKSDWRGYEKREE